MKKMKKFYWLFLILTVNTIFLSSCMKEYIEPGDIKIESRPVSDFNGIIVSDAFELYVSIADSEQLSLEAYSGYLPHIKTLVKAGKLNLYLDDRYEYNSHYKQKVYLKMKSFNYLKASGACKITGSTDFSTENFEMNLSGASYVNMSLLISNTLTCRASGASYINLTGKSSDLNVSDLSGASYFGAFNFITEKASLTISGASDVELNVTKELEFTASGASSVKYKGNPESVKQSISGFSSVVKL